LSRRATSRIGGWLQALCAATKSRWACCSEISAATGHHRRPPNPFPKLLPASPAPRLRPSVSNSIPAPECHPGRDAEVEPLSCWRRSALEPAPGAEASVWFFCLAQFTLSVLAPGGTWTAPILLTAACAPSSALLTRSIAAPNRRVNRQEPALLWSAAPDDAEPWPSPPLFGDSFIQRPFPASALPSTPLLAAPLSKTVGHGLWRAATNGLRSRLHYLLERRLFVIRKQSRAKKIIYGLP